MIPYDWARDPDLCPDPARTLRDAAMAMLEFGVWVVVVAIVIAAVTSMGGVR